MADIPRLIESRLLKAARSFPALILTGPRRSGKTTLLRKLFPRASYHLLEDPDAVACVSADPNTFLEDIRVPAILVVEHPGSDRPGRPGSAIFRKFRQAPDQVSQSVFRRPRPSVLSARDRVRIHVEPIPLSRSAVRNAGGLGDHQTRLNTGSMRALYYFRDQQGLEVDFIVPRGDRRLFLIEAKASRTVTPQMGESLARLGKATSDYGIDCVVVHRAPETTGGGKALRPGVVSSPSEDLLTKLGQR